MSINALIFPPFSERVYHYTDQNGLFGILTSGELWATRIHCLNDRQEFHHGLEILLAAICSVSHVSPTVETLLKKAFESVRSVNICVSSWSQEGDQLSQWRAYGKSKQGYALGLHVEDLKQRAQLAGWKFGKCIYKIDMKRELSKLVAEQFWSIVADHHRGDPTIQNPERLSLLLHAFVFPYASFFKHEGFSEESEWRLVSPPIERVDPLFTVRPGASFPITYYKFPISSLGSDRLKAELTVGPGGSQDLASHGAAVASVRSAFDVTIRKYSFTPWRTDS